MQQTRVMQETWVQFPGQEDLEKEMATPSCIHAWEIPWTEEPGRLQSMSLQKSGIQLSNETTKTFAGWGQGEVLQCIYRVTCAKLRHFSYSWLRPLSLSTPALERCLCLVGDTGVLISNLCV